MVQSVPKKPKAEAKIYGEAKSPRQFTMTDTGSDLIDKLSDRVKCSRSEFVERLVRWADEKWDGQLQRDLSDDKAGEQ